MLVGFAKIVDVTHCTRTCKIQHSIPKAMVVALDLRHSFPPKVYNVLLVLLNIFA